MKYFSTTKKEWNEDLRRRGFWNGWVFTSIVMFFGASSIRGPSATSAAPIVFVLLALGILVRLLLWRGYVFQVVKTK